MAPSLQSSALDSARYCHLERSRSHLGGLGERFFCPGAQCCQPGLEVTNTVVLACARGSVGRPVILNDPQLSQITSTYHPAICLQSIGIISIANECYMSNNSVYTYVCHCPVIPTLQLFRNLLPLHDIQQNQHWSNIDLLWYSCQPKTYRSRHMDSCWRTQASGCTEGRSIPPQTQQRNIQVSCAPHTACGESQQAASSQGMHPGLAPHPALIGSLGSLPVLPHWPRCPAVPLPLRWLPCARPENL